MRSEYLVRIAVGSRYTIAYQEQSNNETVYVDRYTGQVLPSAMLVHGMDRPEWSGDEVCAATAEQSAALLRMALLLKLAAYRAVGRAAAVFRMPQRGIAAWMGGEQGMSGLSLNS